MGLEKDLRDEEESDEVALIDESRERGSGEHMDLVDETVELDLLQFWPVQHPTEPQDEDRPVKCPIPTSSLITTDGGMQEQRYTKGLQRGEVGRAVEKQGTAVAGGGEAPVRAVRKRHHTLTHADGLNPPSALPHQNMTIFQMLQQFDKF